MENLQADVKGKVKLLDFTLGRTNEILESNNGLAITRHQEALTTIVGSLDQARLKVLEEMFKRGDTQEATDSWTAGIEGHVAEVDTKLALLSERLAKIEAEEDLHTKEKESTLKSKEREEQLAFERAQVKQKLEYELKIEECKRNQATKASEIKTSAAQRTKLPKLTIAEFDGSYTDWLRFWNIFEAEIDSCSDLAGVTKLAYLKDLLVTKVRAEIDGLPFSSEGYERAKSTLKSKYGNTSEVVNAYVQNIMALPTISGSNPVKNHHFYENLLFNVQA